MKTSHTKILNINVIVAALGYFVDIYDLLLFGIVRVASLKSIGVPDDKLLEKGVLLINSQMAGMLVGGLFWGVLGDRKGRLSVLFGSIVLYSLANIGNAFVTTVEMYGVMRFLAGVGLAGELGAAITLVSETMSKEHRGYGTTIVASVGILGAVVAALVGDVFDWKTAYIIGGCMGLALLVLRVSMFESGLYKDVKKSSARKGDLKMLISPFPRFVKYIRCIGIGMPLWFVVGILMTFAPEIARDLGVTGAVTAGKAIMWNYAGLAIGDFACGYLSQYLKSRRRALALFISITAVMVVALLISRDFTPSVFYIFASLLGFGAGFWAVFVTVAAEQFGTNLRATVTTTVPNFVRGSVVPLTLGFQALSPSLGLKFSALAMGAITFVIAYVSLYFMQETYGKNLDYIEV